MTMPKGRLHNPDHPSQEVLANGATCGNAIQALARSWSRVDSDGISHGVLVHYPVEKLFHWFDEDEDPVKSPITEATMQYGAEDLPIIAWVVAIGGGSAGVVVDMLERPSRAGMPDERGQPVTYADCQLIRGTPNEVLPREILTKMGLR